MQPSNNTPKRIRYRLLSAFMLMIGLAILAAGAGYLYLYQNNTYQSLQNLSKELQFKLFDLREQERGFLLVDAKNPHSLSDGESIYLDKFQKGQLLIKDLFSQLKRNASSKDLGIEDNVQQAEQVFNQYVLNFNSLSDKIIQRGFKDEGLEGQMRQVAHQLENIKGIDRVQLLYLRRYEKDFFIRKDKEYVDKVYAVLNQLKLAYRGNPNTLNAIQEYERKFERIVSLETEIGLTESEGLKGKLQKSLHAIEQEFSTLNSIIQFRIQNLLYRSALFIGAVFFLMLLVAVSFALYFTNSIATPIALLDRVAQSVVTDLKNQEKYLDKITSKDELGNLANNFKVMLLKLKNKINQANERSDQLEEFTRTEIQRNWHNQGLALFSEIFRMHQFDLERQAFEIISQLVNYTKCNQGGFFTVNRENISESYLELTACYAYERRRYLKKRIEVGEGLIGAAWRESRTILLTDIPDNYVSISSGLGQAKPNALLIVPIKSEEEVEGVIELVSFKEFTDYEIRFVEEICQKIGSVILTVKANQRTQLLLKSSEEASRQAQMREEELLKQVQNYEHWISEFEKKLNRVSDEAFMYQSIINKLFAGFIITDEKFTITRVNNYITKSFNYQKNDLVGQALDILIEADYENIIDLRNKRFNLSYGSFRESVVGRVVDSLGRIVVVEMISGKLEINDQVMYVFLFNELESEEKLGKPSSTVFGQNYRSAS